MKVMKSDKHDLLNWIDQGALDQWFSACPSVTGREHQELPSLDGRVAILIQLQEDTYTPAHLLYKMWDVLIHPYIGKSIQLQHAYTPLHQALEEDETGWLTPLPAHSMDRQFSTNMEKILRIANDMVSCLLEIRAQTPEIQVPWILQLNVSCLDKVSLIFLQRLIVRTKDLPFGIATYYFNQENIPCKDQNVNQLIQIRVKDFYKSLGVDHLKETSIIRSSYEPYPLLNLSLEKALVWCDGYAVLAHANEALDKAVNDEEEPEVLFLVMRAYLFERQLSAAESTLQKITQAHKYSNDIRARAAIYDALLLANHIKRPEDAIHVVRKGISFLRGRNDESAIREMAWLHNVEALTYYRLQQLPQAAKSLQQVKEYIKQLGEEDAALLSSAYAQNSSYLYEAIGKIDAAKQAQHIFIHKNAGQEDRFLLPHWFRIGFLAGKKGELDQALSWLDKAYQACNRLSDSYMQEWIARSTAYLLLQSREMDRAALWLQRSADLCQKIHLLPEWISISTALRAVRQITGVSEELSESTVKRNVILSPSQLRIRKKQLEQIERGEIEIYQIVPKPNSRFFYPFHHFWF
ncbi:tetratricopeptide repeat protein [Paenibacillus sp. FSL K6-1558]|uniref:tetratricopeptide repeat protein n=1 Tax=Paenibacillus sp. FSL K6-1558 TaxID=2921473 RepID=UPI0030F5780A